MKLILWALVLSACLYTLHRLALWLERRGWLYYKHRKASGSALQGALLDFHAVLEPDRRHVIEEQRKEQVEPAKPGAPPLPWTQDD